VNPTVSRRDGSGSTITNGNHFARQLMEHVESIDKDNNQDKIKDVDNTFIMIMR
jgi:hypothetical protein